MESLKIKISILILIILLISGCSSNVDESSIGGTPTYMSIEDCSIRAQNVFKEYGLTKIHSCDEEILMYEGQEVSLINIQHGPGMDCPSGCFYMHLDVLYINENNIMRVNNIPNHRDFILRKEKIPITNIDSLANKDIINYNNEPAIRYKFFKHIEGEIYFPILSSSKQESKIVNITNVSKNITQASKDARELIEEKGYKIRENVANNFGILGKEEPRLDYGGSNNENCWRFQVFLEKNRKNHECMVFICLNDDKHIECR